MSARAEADIMSDPIPFPGEIGGVIVLSVKGATSEPPDDPDPFRVGDVCSFSRFPYRFRVALVDGEQVYFERIS